MDSFFESALNAAALRPDGMRCDRHPDRPGVAGVYAGPYCEKIWLCKECAEPLRHMNGRGYATGLGSEAAQESREAQRYAEEYERMKPYSKERSYL